MNKVLILNKLTLFERELIGLILIQNAVTCI